MVGGVVGGVVGGGWSRQPLVKSLSITIKTCDISTTNIQARPQWIKLIMWNILAQWDKVQDMKCFINGWYCQAGCHRPVFSPETETIPTLGAQYLYLLQLHILLDWLSVGCYSLTVLLVKCHHQSPGHHPPPRHPTSCNILTNSRLNIPSQNNRFYHRNGETLQCKYLPRWY